MRQAENPGDVVGIDELVDSDSSDHVASLHRLADRFSWLGQVSVRANM
jgi:hypothetical protein